MSFEALRADLAELQKALPAAPAAPAAGATEAGEGEGEGEGEILGKSFSFSLADGTQIDAVDGTDLVKSFGARLATTEEGLAKAITDITDVIGAQTALIKSLQEQVAKLAGSGAGRRSVLSVRETVTPGNTEQPLAKSHGHYATGNEAIAAADAAYKAGRIDSLELAKCENFVGRGLQFPADLAAKVSA
jgi:hypothetical protein